MKHEVLSSETKVLTNETPGIHWRKNSWRQLSLIGDETVINLQRTKSLCLLGFCVVLREDLSTF